MIMYLESIGFQNNMSVETVVIGRGTYESAVNVGRGTANHAAFGARVVRTNT